MLPSMPPLKVGLLAVACLPLLSVHAAELTGRFSVLGSAASAERGQSGFAGDGSRTLTADQQSLRLMLDHAGEHSQWSTHLKLARQHVHGLGGAARHSSALFRIRPLAGDWYSHGDGDKTTRVGYELDRAVLQTSLRHPHRRHRTPADRLGQRALLATAQRLRRVCADRPRYRFQTGHRRRGARLVSLGVFVADGRLCAGARRR